MGELSKLQTILQIHPIHLHLCAVWSPHDTARSFDLIQAAARAAPGEGGFPLDPEVGNDCLGADFHKNG